MISFTNEAGAASLLNTRADFVRFLSKWEKSTEEQKYNDWNDFENRYADIYSEVVFNHAATAWAERKQASLTEFFATLPKNKTKILALYNSAPQITQKSIRSIKKVVPDFTDTLIFIFLPTALRFNGMETYLPSRRGEVVLIGVDAVVEWKTNIDVLLTHELFHKHHFEKMALRSSFTSPTSNFWVEGLATYVSQLANPKADLSDVFYSKELAAACKDPEYVKGLAKKYMEVFYRTLTEPERNQFRKDWFLLTGEPTIKRQGYCLGYQIAKLTATTYPISEMAQWGEMTYEDHVERALKQIINKRD